MPTSKLLLCLPELYQMALALVLFFMLIIRPNRNISMAWLPAAAAVNIALAAFSLPLQGILLYQTYQVDALSQFFKLAVAVGFFIAVLNAVRQPTLEDDKRTDYFLLLTISAWGLMLLASTVELVTLYVALEVSSYSLYALIALRGKDPRAAEAGIKYILFGAAATAISLYGFSYILASQHTSYLSELALRSWSFAETPGAVIGLMLFLAGFFYKLALFPFHFWCPDVYQGASNETATYVATLPKLGAVVVLIRLASLLEPGFEVTTLIAVLGAVSMTYGNFAALAQKDLKRILGYSSVAHAGYITLGLVSGTAMGLAAAAFYAVVYLIMNLTCFWVICRLSGNGENLQLADLGGLFKRHPFLAFVLAVSAFSLVGLPPTAGFMGKLFLITSAWNHGYNWLIIIAALNTAISIYYYLNIVRHAYTKEEPETPIQAKPGGAVWGGVLAAAVLFLGVMPSPVFQWALNAGKQLLP
ncbi:MAG: NADH-quinone oxidoreductase subunit N [Desulfovibrionaceae bacterium]